MCSFTVSPLDFSRIFEIIKGRTVPVSCCSLFSAALLWNSAHELFEQCFRDGAAGSSLRFYSRSRAEMPEKNNTLPKLNILQPVK